MLRDRDHCGKNVSWRCRDSDETEAEQNINTENAEVTTRELEKIVQEMKIAIRDSLSVLGSANNEEDGNDEDGDGEDGDDEDRDDEDGDDEDGDDEDDEDTDVGNVSKDDKPRLVVGTISTTAKQQMERFQQCQIKHNELTQPG
jgi:hypothetical protein